MAPAHPHTTGVAVYPALFLFSVSFSTFLVAYCETLQATYWSVVLSVGHRLHCPHATITLFSSEPCPHCLTVLHNFCIILNNQFCYHHHMDHMDSHPYCAIKTMYFLLHLSVFIINYISSFLSFFVSFFSS